MHTIRVTCIMWHFTSQKNEFCTTNMSSLSEPRSFPSKEVGTVSLCISIINHTLLSTIRAVISTRICISMANNSDSSLISRPYKGEGFVAHTSHACAVSMVTRLWGDRRDIKYMCENMIAVVQSLGCTLFRTQMFCKWWVNTSIFFLGHEQVCTRPSCWVPLG